MQEKQHYKWGLRKQLVFFTTALALITYTTSGFFIYIIYPFVTDYIQIGEMTFTIITLLLGIIWSGILAFVAAAVHHKTLTKVRKGCHSCSVR